MIPEREREALMRLTMCAREECGMCKYKETCDFDFQYETATRCMNILADALNTDRKTESNSEKPNNCEVCKHWEYDAKYRWWHCPLQDNGMYECHYEPRKLTAVEDEPTISKMEQVDKDINVRSKDEPQTPMCETCRYDEPNNPICDECIAGEDKPSNYEPQTDCPWK